MALFKKKESEDKENVLERPSGKYLNKQFLQHFANVKISKPEVSEMLMNQIVDYANINNLIIVKVIQSIDEAFCVSYEVIFSKEEF